MKISVVLFTFFVISFFTSVTTDGQKLLSFPGQPAGVNFRQFAGYVTVDEEAGRSLFYYFVESPNPWTSPLVLWLNGGPGCSSLGAGAFTELGPFRVRPDGQTLQPNEFAWNSVANVIFLESPAGVGFSYSNTTSDYRVGDQRTALDAYIFLTKWLDLFPEYEDREFYITGESYGGHYVPQLALLIVQKNNGGNQRLINLRGIAMGNALVDYETQNWGTYDYLWSHAIISDEVYQRIVSTCNFSSPTAVSVACTENMNKAREMMGVIDHYNIYYPMCSSNSVGKNLVFDPCSPNYVDTYLNNPQVQNSLGVNLTGSLPGRWRTCNDDIHAHWLDQPDSVVDVIEALMSSRVRVWMYSGDADAVVSVTATRYALSRKVRKPVKTPWHAWYYKGEVGGYVIEYEGISFVTVRGAGHFVPSYEPGRALTVFKYFLRGGGELPPSD